MTFQQAVEATADLAGAWRPGLQALKSVDKLHVKAQNTRRLTGSTDVDAALQPRWPQDNRWDYAIGHQPANRQGEMICWVEVHPASAGDTKVVLAKLDWLQKWLIGAAHLNAMPREFVWVSSGTTSFSLTAPQQKQWALRGLQHKGRVFTIPDQAVV